MNRQARMADDDSLRLPVEASIVVSTRRQRGRHSLNSRASCAAVRRATMEDKKELLDRVSAFILDCDGVVWRGDKVIEGVPETLDWLRAQVCASASPAFVSRRT